MYNIDIPGWMMELELQHIEKIAQNVPDNGNVLEIGSFLGRSAWAWAKSIPVTATLHCIDYWSDNIIESSTINGIPPKEVRNGLDLFLINTKDCHNIVCTKSSSSIITSFRESYYDVVFLDGTHSNPSFSSDLVFSYGLIKPGGILCGHDFGTRFPDVTEEVTKLATGLGIPINRQPNSTIWELRL